MSGREANLLEKAMTLPPAERADLAERLLASLDPPSQKAIDEAWAKEAEDRLDAHSRGEIESISAQEVFEGIRRRKPR